MNPDVKTALYIGGVLIFTLGAFKLLAAKPNQQNLRQVSVALLGDSLTAAPQYSKYLRQLLGNNSTVRAFGYPGQGTGTILAHAEEALASNPTYLVVLGGVNDIASNRSPNQTISNLSEIYRRATRRDIKVIAVLLTPWASHRVGCAAKSREETELINDWIVHEARYEAPISHVVDTSSLGDKQGRLKPQYDSGDGLHLNRMGQQTLATLVSQAL